MKKFLFPLLSVSAILFTSCEKDNDTCSCSPVEPTREKYDFENVDHSGQDTRLDMLSEIVDYAKSSNSGKSVDGTILLDMFANTNYTWTKAELNSSTKQIADKISPDAQNEFSEWIMELDSISQNPGVGANGVAGLVENGGKTKQYLFNAKGYELGQLIEKGSMGALAYYQSTSVYFSSSKMNVDNETVEPGKGTAMQHHWDEAFGYWGVPNDFGTEGFEYDNTAAYHRFWAKYTNSVDANLSVNATLMKAFIKGREAINDKNYTARDAAISEIRSTWEMVSVAMAIHYLNGAKADLADDALRNHQLSEAVGFIWSLQFNPEQKMMDSEIVNLISNNLDNLYEVSVADLNTVIDQLAAVYGLEAVKNNL